MNYDKRDVLSSAQSLADGVTISTNYKNLGGDYNLGVGEPIGVALTVNTGAATASGSGTFTFELEVAPVSTFVGSNVLISRTIPGADLTEGSVHVLPIPADKGCKQFLRSKYTLVGDAPTVTISAVIMPVKGIPQTNIHYAAGSSVGT